MSKRGIEWEKSIKLVGGELEEMAVVSKDRRNLSCKERVMH